MLLIPAASLALVSIYLASNPDLLSGPQASSLLPAVCAAVAAGAAGLVAAAVGLRNSRRARSLRTERDLLEADRGRLLDRNKGLQEQVELLSAMREVTRVVSNTPDFEEILGEVLRIVEDLVNAEEITIFLLDETTGRLTPHAQRRQKKNAFGRQIKHETVNDDNVAEAAEHRSLLRVIEGDALHSVIPLQAHREMIGVLKLDLTIEGTPAERTAKMDRYEQAIRSIARHISVAIKTAHLHDRAVIDGLTGLYTKRYFTGQIEAQLEAARRHRRPLSLIMLDLDHFKAVNDEHGHLTGDEVLIGVAELLQKNLRKYDTAHRYGGEEIILILPDTQTEKARAIAERIRERIEAKHFRTTAGRRLQITASLGVAALHPGVRTTSAFIQNADQALYQAKNAGRNRVCVWQPSPDSESR